MSDKLSYYQTRHDTGPYGNSEFNLRNLFRQSALKKWAAHMDAKDLRIADIGCGKGRFLEDFINEIQKEHRFRSVVASATDLIRAESENLIRLGSITKNFDFHQVDLESSKLPFADASFDFISCNHVLEHIFKTEHVVRELHRVVDPKGICVISIPNIACWLNRIHFLFAGQPRSSEIGIEKGNYGMWPPFIKKVGEKWETSGHIRDFTPRGLRDLCEHCGFKTVGWWQQGFALRDRITKWSGLNIGIILKR